MQPFSTRALGALGFSALLSLTAACGGSHQDAKAPTTDSADAPRVGSDNPDPVADTTSQNSQPLPDPPKSISVASNDKNGADIIPPFSSGNDPAAGAAPAPAKKAGKKKAAKSKKKVASSGT